MDETHILSLNNDCLLEIMKYIIRNCETSGGSSNEEKYADLINFGLSAERFHEALRLFHKKIYNDLQFIFLALQNEVEIKFSEIQKQLKNTSSKRRTFFWRSYANAIQANNNLTNIKLLYTPEYYCGEFLDAFQSIKDALHNKPTLRSVVIKLRGYSLDCMPQLEHLEGLDLDVRMDAASLVECCRSNPGLKRLSFMNTEIYGRLSDIAPHCSNLESLTFEVKPGVCVDQYVPLAKMPKLSKMNIKGEVESGSLLKLFEGLRRWRTSSDKSLALIIQDAELDFEETSVLAGVNGLKQLQCCFKDFSESANPSACRSSIEPLKQAADLHLLYITKLCEPSEASVVFNMISEFNAGIFLVNETGIMFEPTMGRLELRIPAVSDADARQLGKLSAPPNICQLIIVLLWQNETTNDSLRSFFNELASAESSTLQELLCDRMSIGPQELKEIASIVTLRKLRCVLSDMRNVKHLGMLNNLTELRITAPPSTSGVSLEDLFRALAKENRCVLQNFSLGKRLLDVAETAALAQIKSIRTLNCAFSGAECIDHLIQLNHLQYLRIFVRQGLDRVSNAVLRLLDVCQAQADIQGMKFRIVFQKKEKALRLIIKTYEPASDMLTPLAGLENVECMEIEGPARIGWLNAFLGTLGTSESNTLKDLKLRGRWPFGEIAKVAEIQTLTALECDLSDTKDIEILAQMNQLQTLTVTSHIYGNLVPLFRQLAAKDNPEIKYLRLPGMKISPDEISQVSRIQSLQRLDCEIGDASDAESMTQLAGSSIQQLVLLSDATNPLESLFAAFAANEQSCLQHLAIKGRHFSTEECAKINQIKSLNAIESGMPIRSYRGYMATDAAQKCALRHLALEMPTLTKLYLSFLVGSTKFKYLAQIGALQSLYCSIDDNEGIEILAQLKNLEALTVNRSNSPLSGLFRVLQTLPKLKKLHIRNLVIDWKDTREISLIKSLKILHIVIEKADKNISELTKLRELEHLGIRLVGRVSHECLKIFEACTMLNSVVFYGFVTIVPTFIAEVYTILRSVRDAKVQGPLHLKFELNAKADRDSSFPEFPLIYIDEAYLKFSFSHADEGEDFNLSWYNVMSRENVSLS